MTNYETYARILAEELVPAMGCTEPIAVAYAAAIAAGELGEPVRRGLLRVSANIIKNVKSVVVPNTGGLRGLSAAVAAGVIAGRPERELEVIAEVDDTQREAMRTFLAVTPIVVEQFDNGLLLDIEIELAGENHRAKCRIAGHHTHVVRVERDGACVRADDLPCEQSGKADHSLLNVSDIVSFADAVDIKVVRAILERQIDYNMAIAAAGINGNYGSRIGKILLQTYGGEVHNRAKAYAAAASDARMNGCSLPVVINSGSGNQGITASVPVIIYAQELKMPQETLLRALVVSNLITIHLKTGIGPLSAYCGAISAGCGAAAGIAYLYGGRQDEIAHTVVNALAINSGVICDGAKSSCAAKIASAIEGGLLGMQMYFHGSQFYGGDGIITKGVENTIRNVGRLARNGMAETDREIIDIMISGNPANGNS